MVVDLGGTFLRCGLASADNSITALERIRLPGTAFSRSDAIWALLVESIADYATRHCASMLPSAPIAISFPGPISNGKVTAAPTVLGGDVAMPDVRALLADRTRREVTIVNDVSAAAWYLSERVNAQRFAVVTVSSGIGAKIFDRGNAIGVLDDSPYAGELGHIVVDRRPQAVLCDCGGRGHLGAIASARGIERGARIAALEDPAAFGHSACALFGATAPTLTNEAHLVPALRAGDRWSSELLRRSLVPLGQTLASLIVGCGLDAVVIMGGFAQQLGEVYRCALRDALSAVTDQGPAQVVADNLLIIAGADEEPSLAGAAAYARLGRCLR